MDEPTPKKSTNVDISFSNTPAIVEDVSVDMNVTNEPTTSNVDNLSVDNLSDLEENPGDKIENCSNQGFLPTFFDISTLIYFCIFKKHYFHLSSLIG